MSKEMTPKESLQIIQDNLTPRTLGIFPVEFKIVEQALDRLEQLEIENRNNEKVIADGVKLMNRNLELQSRLESLEKENKKWREIVGCDLCEALGREILLEENEKLKKENQALRNGIDLDLNAKLLSENELLKMNVKDTYDTGQEIICELTQENEKLQTKLEKIKQELDYLGKQDFSIFNLTNGTLIFGVDISNNPTIQAVKKTIFDREMQRLNKVLEQ